MPKIQGQSRSSNNHSARNATLATTPNKMLLEIRNKQVLGREEESPYSLESNRSAMITREVLKTSKNEQLTVPVSSIAKSTTEFYPGDLMMLSISKHLDTNSSLKSLFKLHHQKHNQTLLDRTKIIRQEEFDKPSSTSKIVDYNSRNMFLRFVTTDNVIYDRSATDLNVDHEDNTSSNGYTRSLVKIENNMNTLSGSNISRNFTNKKILAKNSMTSHIDNTKRLHSVSDLSTKKFTISNIQPSNVFFKNSNKTNKRLLTSKASLIETTDSSANIYLKLCARNLTGSPKEISLTSNYTNFGKNVDISSIREKLMYLHRSIREASQPKQLNSTSLPEGIIVCELDKEKVSKERNLFVIGDGIDCGIYSNAPLDAKKKYAIYIVAINFLHETQLSVSDQLIVR